VQSYFYKHTDIVGGKGRIYKQVNPFQSKLPEVCTLGASSPHFAGKSQITEDKLFVIIATRSGASEASSSTGSGNASLCVSSSVARHTSTRLVDERQSDASQSRSARCQNEFPGDTLSELAIDARIFTLTAGRSLGKSSKLGIQSLGGLAILEMEVAGIAIAAAASSDIRDWG